MIGVVTVAYNSADVLADFMESLRAQTVEFRLYVVDNASSDGTLEALGEYDDPWLVVLAQPENLGIAVGNNVGIEAALADGCEQVLLLNNDTVFEPTLFAELVDRAARDEAGVVVPSIRYFDQPDSVWFESADFARWRGAVPVANAPRPPDTVTPIECACTCCALIDASVFDVVGRMDERYFVYWDDTDFFFRCDAAGVDMVLDTGISMLHKVSSLTGGGDSLFSQRERTKNRVYFIRKHQRGLRRVVGLLGTMANVIRLAITSRPRGERLRALTRAYRDGLAIPVDTAPVGEPVVG